MPQTYISNSRRKLRSNLLEISVDIEEKGNLSEYFNIFNIKEEYGKGIHTATIRGSERLEKGSYVYFEILDEAGDSIPINIPSEYETYEQDLLPNRRFTFEITENNVSGLGKIVFVGTTKEGKKVRWIKTFSINTQIDSFEIRQRGDWGLDTFYEIGDVVQYQGTSYVSILAHKSLNDNIPPDATYWKTFAEKGDPTVQYVIQPTNGTVLRNNTGSLELQLVKIVADSVEIVSSGNIVLADEANTILTVGGGISDGGNGVQYNPVIGASAIDGNKVIKAIDSSTTETYDTISLLDINDGVSGGAVEASKGLFLVRDPNNADAYTPSSTILSASFIGSDETVYDESIEITPNYGTEDELKWAYVSDNTDISVAVKDENGVGIAENTFDATKTITATFTFTDPNTSQVIQISESVVIISEGVDGIGGSDAKVVRLTSEDQSFVYNTNGSNPSPSSATITAQAQNIEGTPYYDFFVDGFSQQNTTSNTFTYNPQSLYSGMPQTIEVEVREGSDTGTVVASDIFTVFGLKAGENAYTIIVSNEAHTLPVTNDGVVTYTGSGTSITAFEGTNQLTYDDSLPYGNSTFRVSAVGTNITADSIPSIIGGNKIVFGDASNISALEDEANIEFTITIVNEAGIESVFTKNQSFAKSVQGDDGSNAEELSVKTTSQVIQIAKDGSLSPSTITIDTVKNNITGTPSWSVVSGTYGGTTPDGNSLSVDTSLVTSDTITFQASLSGQTDTISIIKVREGTDSLNGYLTNESHTLQAGNDGAVGSAEIQQATTDFEIFQGTTKLTESIDYTLSYGTITSNLGTGVSSGITMNAISGNTASLNTISNGVTNATVEIIATIGSETITKIFSLSKSLEGDKGDKGDLGDLGLSLLFRGQWDSGSTYERTDAYADVVIYNSSYYYLPEGQTTSTNDIPSNGLPWEPFSGDFQSIATSLLLAEDVTIRRSLTMGDATEEGENYGSTGIIRSLGGFDINGNITYTQGDIVNGRIFQLDKQGLYAYQGQIGGVNIEKDRLVIDDNANNVITIDASNQQFKFASDYNSASYESMFIKNNDVIETVDAGGLVYTKDIPALSIAPLYNFEATTLGYSDFTSGLWFYATGDLSVANTTDSNIITKITLQGFDTYWRGLSSNTFEGAGTGVNAFSFELTGTSVGYSEYRILVEKVDGLNSDIDVTNINVSQYKTKTTFNNLGIFSSVAPNKIISLGGDSDSASVGRLVIWDNITAKPFTTVKTDTGHFVIASDELQLPQGLATTSNPEFAKLLVGVSSFSGTETARIAGDIVIGGNVEIAGTLNYTNSDNLQVEDKTITINKNGTDATAENAGIIFERPLGDKSILWNSTNGFTFNDNIKAVNLNLTGAIQTGSITSGFGNIDIGSSDFKGRSIELENIEYDDASVFTGSEVGGKLAYDASVGLALYYGSNGSGITKGIAVLLDVNNTLTDNFLSITGGTSADSQPSISFDQSQITGVGVLDAGSITSNFGGIDIGSSSFAGGSINAGSLSAGGVTTITSGNDTPLRVVSTDANSGIEITDNSGTLSLSYSGLNDKLSIDSNIDIGSSSLSAGAGSFSSTVKIDRGGVTSDTTLILDSTSGENANQIFRSNGVNKYLIQYVDSGNYFRLYDYNTDSTVWIHDQDTDVFSINKHLTGTSATFSGDVTIEETLPRLALIDTGALTDEGDYFLQSKNGTFTLNARNDANTNVDQVFNVQRTGLNVDSFNFDVPLTGTSATFSGDVSINSNILLNADGTISKGSITSGFGSIDIGSSSLTAGSATFKSGVVFETQGTEDKNLIFREGATNRFLLQHDVEGNYFRLYDYNTNSTVWIHDQDTDVFSINKHLTGTSAYFSSDINYNSQLVYNKPSTGGWSRGLSYEIASTGVRDAQIGGYGSGEITNMLFMGFGTSVYSSGNGLYVFDGGKVSINRINGSGANLDVNGTGNFEGHLTGTSATFSSTGLFGDTLTVSTELADHTDTSKFTALRLRNIFTDANDKHSAVDFKVSRWEAGGDDRPETQLDIVLSGNAGGTYNANTPNIDLLTLRSDYKIGINNQTPTRTLDVNGTGAFSGHLTGTSAQWSDTTTYTTDSAILKNNDTGRVLIGGGSAYSLSNGAYIALEGRDRGGVDQGGTIGLVPASTGILSVTGDSEFNGALTVINQYDRPYASGDHSFVVFDADQSDQRSFVKIKKSDNNTTASAPRVGLDLDIIDHTVAGQRARTLFEIAQIRDSGAGGLTSLSTSRDFSIYTHNGLTASSGEFPSDSSVAGTPAMRFSDTLVTSYLPFSGTSATFTDRATVRYDYSGTTVNEILPTNDTFQLLNETDITGNYTSIGFTGNAGEITSRIVSIADASNGRGSLVLMTSLSSNATPTEFVRLNSAGTLDISVPLTGTNATFSGNVDVDSLDVVGSAGTSSFDESGVRLDMVRTNSVSYITNSDTGGSTRLALGAGTTSPDMLLIYNDLVDINVPLTGTSATWSGNLSSLAPNLFASQTTGWQITNAGQADFRSIYSDEIRTKAFIAEINESLVGAQFITKSRGRISRNFTVPSNAGTGTLYIEDLEGFEGSQVFSDGDTIRLDVMDKSGGGLIVAQIWGTVSSYSDLSGGEQSWTFTTTDDGGSAGDAIQAGSLALDYGKSGDGFIVATTLDQQGAPYQQMTRWTTDASDPSNYEVLTRTGVLTGINSPTYGALQKSGFYGINNYLEGNTQIAGTLTAGDANGVGNTFYAGRINKNIIKSSRNLLSGWYGQLSASLTTAVESPTGDPVYFIESTNSTGTNDRWERQVSLSPNTTYTFSCYYLDKDFDGGILQIELYGVGDFEGTNAPSTSFKNDISTTQWKRFSVTFTTTATGTSSAAKILRFSNCTVGKGVYATSPQIEEGENSTNYQPTDNTVSLSDTGFGMWATAGGFGGTMQNPVVSLSSAGMKVESAGYTTNVSGNGTYIGNFTSTTGFDGTILNEDGLYGYQNNALVMKVDDTGAKLATWDIDSNRIYNSTTKIQIGSGLTRANGWITIGEAESNRKYIQAQGSSGKFVSIRVDEDDNAHFYAYADGGNNEIVLGEDYRVVSPVGNGNFTFRLRVNGNDVIHTYGTTAKISGWTATDTTFTGGNIVLDKNGIIKNTTQVNSVNAYEFLNDGSGHVAGGNISWDLDGNATFRGSLQIGNTTINRIYARGTGNDNNANRLLKINGEIIYNSTGRGLRLTVYNSSMTLRHDTTYDTYNTPAHGEALADILEGTANLSDGNVLAESDLIILTSQDASRDQTAGNTLSDAIDDCGGNWTRLSQITSNNGYRTPYSFLGQKGLGRGNGIEVWTSVGAGEPYAEVTGVYYNGILRGDAGGVGTRIVGDRISTGIIKSNNWGSVKGTYFDLDNGRLLMRFGSADVFDFNAGAGTAKIAGWGFDNERIENEYATGVFTTIGNPSWVATSFRGFHVGSDASNRVVLGEIDGEYEIYAMHSSNLLFQVGSRGNNIAGWEFTNKGLSKWSQGVENTDYKFMINAVDESVYRQQGFAVYRYEAGVGKVKTVNMGKLHALDSIATTSTDYGFEIMSEVTSGVFKHLFRVGGDTAKIAGWNFDTTGLYSSTTGLFVGAGKNINILNTASGTSAFTGLMVDANNYLGIWDGDPYFRAGDATTYLQLDTSGTSQLTLVSPELTIDNTGADFSGKLTAPSGDVGGLILNDGKIYEVARGTLGGGNREFVTLSSNRTDSTDTVGFSYYREDSATGVQNLKSIRIGQLGDVDDAESFVDGDYGISITSGIVSTGYTPVFRIDQSRSWISGMSFNQDYMEVRGSSMRFGQNVNSISDGLYINSGNHIYSDGDFKFSSDTLLIDSGTSVLAEYSPTDVTSSTISNANFTSTISLGTYMNLSESGWRYDTLSSGSVTYDGTNDYVIFFVGDATSSNRLRLWQNETTSVSNHHGNTIKFTASIGNPPTTDAWDEGTLELKIYGWDGSQRVLLGITTLVSSDVTNALGTDFSVSAFIPSWVDDLSFNIEFPEQDTSAQSGEKQIHIFSTTIEEYDSTQVSINSEGMSIYRSPVNYLKASATDGLEMKGMKIQTNNFQLPVASDTSVITPDSDYASVAVRVVSGVIRLYIKLPDGTEKYVTVNT